MRGIKRVRRSVLGALALMTGAVLWGCSGNDAGVGADGGDGNWPGNCQPQLYLVSAQHVIVPMGMSAELKVRYACGGTPLPGSLVGFAIEGEAKGSALSSSNVQTDAEGVATVTLLAGNAPTSFEVHVSAEHAQTLVIDVDVSSPTNGTIVVFMKYGGQIAFNEFKAYLFEGRDCTAIDPFAVTGAMREAPAVAALSATPTFTEVPARTNYTVAVVAKQQGKVLGYGCTPGLIVNGGQTTNADVTINDIPITYQGVYLLDNHFDMAGTLPPDVANIVHIFDEMSDDHEVEGSVAKDQWGIDPAAFLLDFVYRQFCKWECTNANPSWDDCTPGTHPTGDLKETYRRLQGKTAFMNWSGCQPRVTALCGILDPFWGVTQFVQQQVQATIPAELINISEVVGDIARAIDKMHVTSTLSLVDVRPGRQGNFTHTLKTMLLDLHDLNGTVHHYEVDLAAAGVGNLSYSGNTTTQNDELLIPEHTFLLKFGLLFQYIYKNYLLPLLGCQPPNNTTACLFGKIVNCQDVGQWLYDGCTDMFGVGICPVSASDFASYCTAGLTVAGTYVDATMATWISDETRFTLQGSASAGTLNDHREALTLKDGVWHGRWDVQSGQGKPFPGTFTGTRQ